MVAHHNGAQWDDFGGVTSGTVAQGYVTSTSRLTSFSPVTFGSTDWDLNPLPVELIAFEAQWEKGTRHAHLTWRTASETNNARFELERSFNTADWTMVATVEGHGTTSVPQHYGHVDRNVAATPVYYRLRQVDFDGASHLSQVVVLNAPTPTGLWIAQALPNPFRDTFRVNVQTEEKGNMVLRLVDVQGKVVTTLEAPVNAGENQIDMADMAHLPGGLYLLTVEQSGRKQTLRVIKQ